MSHSTSSMSYKSSKVRRQVAWDLENHVNNQISLSSDRYEMAYILMLNETGMNLSYVNIQISPRLNEHPHLCLQRHNQRRRPGIHYRDHILNSSESP